MSSIKVNENIGIKNIKKFHSELIDVLKKGRELVIDFNRVSNIDLSVAQVLLSARKTAMGSNGNIKLKGVSADVKEQLSIAGLLKSDGGIV